MTGAPRTDARYVVPSYVERTAHGVKESDPYSKLFEERIVFIGTPIDDACASDVVAALIALEAMDVDATISLYINSPGGSLTALMAIYDTMQYVQPDIETTCLGQAASSAAVLLAAGTPGKRAALPNARLLLEQPAIEGERGASTDLEIHAREVLRLRAQMERVIARHTGREVNEVRTDIERDRFFTAEQARDYGLIDEILTVRKRR